MAAVRALFISTLSIYLWPLLFLVTTTALPPPSNHVARMDTHTSTYPPRALTSATAPLATAGRSSLPASNSESRPTTGVPMSHSSSILTANTTSSTCTTADSSMQPTSTHFAMPTTPNNATSPLWKSRKNIEEFWALIAIFSLFQNTASE